MPKIFSKIAIFIIWIPTVICWTIFVGLFNGLMKMNALLNPDGRNGNLHQIFGKRGWRFGGVSAHWESYSEFRTRAEPYERILDSEK